MARKYGNGSEQANQIQQELFEEAKKKESLMKKVRVGVCVGVIVVALILNVTKLLSIVSITNDTAELNSKITESQQTLQEKQNEQSNSEANVVYNDPVANNSYEAGVAVQDLQNAISAESAKEDAKRATAKDTKVVLTDEHKKLLQQLQLYFPDQQSAIKTWSKYGTWSYTSDFVYEGETIDTAWLCYQKGDSSRNKLLAVATATYNANSGKFDKFNLYLTSWYDALSKKNNTDKSYGTMSPTDGSAGLPDKIHN